MSNHLITAAYKANLRTPMRKSVMVLLADKASDDGSGIWASKQTMADELCCSKQAVIDTIKGFIADGLLIERGQRRSPNGFTVEYQIVVAALNAVPLVNCHADKAPHQSTTLTGQPAGPVKEIDPTSQPAGPHQSTSLTRTLLEPSRTLPSQKATPSSKTRAISATSMPQEWEPKPFGVGTEARAVVDDWSPGELARQVEHFTAHHLAKGDTFKDWQMAWKTWVLKSRTFNRGKHHSGPSATGYGRTGDAIARFVAGG